MKNLKLLLTATVCSGLLHASEPSILDVSPHAIASFKTIFQKNQESLELISYGGSFIEKGEFVGSSQFEVRDTRPLRGGILMWMGEGRGAKNNDIFLIFLIESGLLGVVGGVIGIALGIAIGKGVEYIAFVQLGSPFLKAVFGLPLILGALAFSFVIGAASGVLPAMQAAKLRPTDALRYE